MTTRTALSRPELATLSDGRVSAGWPAPGPFIVLTYAQLNGLIAALYDADMLTVNGLTRRQAARPAPKGR